jgi:hypothetical protein
VGHGARGSSWAVAVCDGLVISCLVGLRGAPPLGACLGRDGRCRSRVVGLRGWLFLAWWGFGDNPPARSVFGPRRSLPREVGRVTSARVWSCAAPPLIRPRVAPQVLWSVSPAGEKGGRSVFSLCVGSCGVAACAMRCEPQRGAANRDDPAPLLARSHRMSRAPWCDVRAYEGGRRARSRRGGVERATWRGSDRGGASTVQVGGSPRSPTTPRLDHPQSPTEREAARITATPLFIQVS